MPEESEPEYNDEKATRVKLDKDTEYVAVLLEGDIEIGGGFGAGTSGLKAEARRGKKQARVLARYIKDTEWGLIPLDAWEQKKREEVAGTLSQHMDTPITADDVIVSGVEPVTTYSCPRCKKTILRNSKYCRFCGAILETD